jgi:glycerol-3-phosphate dehydrogenase
VTWTSLLANKEAQKHKTSKKELDNMRALIARDLADAAIAGLSSDRRFATAYNAALQAANMAIACAGYRIVSKVGHHRVSFESVKLVLGKPADKYADYFETCRRKRNTIDYTFCNVATQTEASEILAKASWTRQKYNSFTEYPTIAVHLRRAATPELAGLIQDALRRRNELAPYARREIYRELATYLQSEISISRRID